MRLHGTIAEVVGVGVEMRVCVFSRWVEGIRVRHGGSDKSKRIETGNRYTSILGLKGK